MLRLRERATEAKPDGGVVPTVIGMVAKVFVGSHTHMHTCTCAHAHTHAYARTVTRHVRRPSGLKQVASQVPIVSMNWLGPVS